MVHVTHHLLSGIETDDLIYLDPIDWSDEALMAEQERCQEVLDLHSPPDGLAPEDDPSGVIEDEYLTRVGHIEWMRSERRRYAGRRTQS